MIYLVVGIDPGLNGGLVKISYDAENNNYEFQESLIMPKYSTKGNNFVDGGKVYRWLCDGDTWEADLIVIELVHSMPKQGVASTFKFGMGFGSVITAADSTDAERVLVTPQKWKKEILPNTDKDKKAAINYAQSRYPNISLKATPRCKTAHDGLADAVCLAEYGIRLLSKRESAK